MGKMTVMEDMTLSGFHLGFFLFGTLCERIDFV